MTPGETVSRELPGGSGALHRQHFCPEYLTRTHTEMLAHPDVINVRAGTLAEPRIAKPIAQIWTSSPTWAIAPGIQSFEENPEDVPALAAAWQASLGAGLASGD